MNVKSFLETIYVGDRGCKSITLDGWNKVVRVQVDSISRIRSASGAWNYYTEEDIDDGVLVFTDVATCELNNHGQLPNDQMNAIDVISEEVDGSYVVELSIDAVNAEATHTETILQLRCKGVHLEDPSRPGVKITT